MLLEIQGQEKGDKNCFPAIFLHPKYLLNSDGQAIFGMRFFISFLDLAGGKINYPMQCYPRIPRREQAHSARISCLIFLLQPLSPDSSEESEKAASASSHLWRLGGHPPVRQDEARFKEFLTLSYQVRVHYALHYRRQNIPCRVGDPICSCYKYQMTFFYTSDNSKGILKEIRFWD